MGSFTSGRRRTVYRGNVDQTCRIDVRVLRKQGHLVEGQEAGGTFRWTRRGRDVGSIRYRVILNPEDRRLILYDGKAEAAKTTTIALEAVPMRYGGFRYYARCPKSLRRCEVLPIVDGVVACRQWHKLAYVSQSLDELGRLRERMTRCDKQLREKVRRGRIRAELTMRWMVAKDAHDALFVSDAKRRFGWS